MIPRLIIGGGGADAPGLWDSAADGVQVWREADGTAFAYCATVDGLHRIDMPGVARFCFRPGRGDVQAFHHPPVESERVRHAYRGVVLPMVLQASGTEVLHASAVRTRDGVVALCADSGIGKSTLAVGWGQRGHPVWADDTVAVDTSGRSVMAVPLPFEIRLRPAAAAFLRNGRGMSTEAAAEPVPVTALCVLRRADRVGNAVAVRALQPSLALPAVLAHGYCFSLHDPERKRRMVRHYLELVARVPVFEVCFQIGLDRVPEILDAIEQALN